MEEVLDDPFDLFVESEEEDAEVRNGIYSQEAKGLVRDLLRKANGTSKIVDSDAPPFDVSTQALANEEVFTAVKGLRWKDPDYMGPISIVKSGSMIGGGRQAIASEDLRPGSLLLLEKPLVSWSPERNRLDLDFVRMVISTCSNVEQLLHCVEDLHPTKDDVDGIHIKEGSQIYQIQQMMEDLDIEYEDNPGVDTILEQLSSQNISNAGGTTFRRADLLRFLLALRYNGLETGLYMYTSMLNHNDRPNCVKFRGGELSEVRATRWIRKGEMLTISYVPTILCHASRRRQLWKQHRFDIGEEPPEELRTMELVANKVPPSYVGNEQSNTLTDRIEDTLRDLSSHVEELESSPKPNANQAIALELASMELYRSVLEQLENADHILLLPCLKLHVDACLLVQKDSLMQCSSRIQLLERLVSSAIKLLKLQRMVYGPDHFDVARTSLDLAEAVGELKSRNVTKLIRLDLEGLTTPIQCATYESKLRKDYNRIKLLYETQVSS